MRPKLNESHFSPRSTNGFGVNANIQRSLNDSDYASQCSPRRGAVSLLSPILKKGRNRDSTKAASSVRTGAFDIMNSFDNSKYKVSVLDIV